MVHAALDCRAAEVALALALDQTDGDKLVLTEEVDKLAWILKEWIPTSKHRSLGKVHRWDVGRGNLWVAPPGVEVAVRDLQRLVVLNAHSIERNPITRTLRCGDIWVLGAMPPRGHWSLELRDDADSMDVLPASLLIESFPDQERAVLPDDDPLYQRLMACEDVDPPPPAPFETFATSRLRIRTDKGPEYLSERQRAEAQDMLGEGWHKSSTPPIVTFEPSPVQLNVEAEKARGRAKGYSRFIIIKYRRGGITSYEQGLSYQTCVDNPGAMCMSFADTGTKASRIFTLVSLFETHDPRAPGLVGDSASVLKFSNGSSFHVGTAGGRAGGRGDTIQRFHGSEVPFWCEGPRQLSQVEEVMAGISEATANGEICLEGTPNGREWCYHTYQDAKKGLNDYWPIFLRWFDDPRNVAREGTYDPEEIRETLNSEEMALIAQHGLSLAQIAFRRSKKRALKKLFEQEYPEDDESCFLTSGTCYFDTDFLLDRLRVVEEDEGLREHVPGGYVIRWKEPVPGRKYVAGCDTSEGLPNCDLNGIGILDKETGEQVFTLHGLFKPAQLAELAVKYCKEYNDALLGIERENHGYAVLQKVIELGYGRPHYKGGPLFYFQKGQDQKDQRHKKLARAGWSTNSVTRPLMLEELAEAMNEGAFKPVDRDFMGECLTFRLQTNGRFEADSGAHDDTVMKWAIAWQMRKYRKRKSGIRVLQGTL